MELVVDAAGHPAPRLVDARVAAGQAAALYADLRSQAIRMLGCDLIHGDLSPYNVLLGRNGPVVIDFPQVIGAAHNSQAERFFRRDLENLRRFFAALDPALQRASGDAGEIWRAYVRRELSGDFVPTGRAAEPPGRGPAGADARPARGAHGRGKPRQHHERAEPPQHPSGGTPRPAARPPLPGPTDRPPGRRDRPRPPAPAPEVVRVVRSHGPAATPPRGPAPAAAAAPGQPTAGPRVEGGPGQGGQRRRRRRRRRR